MASLQDDPFLDTSIRLTPSDAVAAIITVDNRYLMQYRDEKRGIFYPGHWGLFGGGVEAGEDEATALHRELREELGIEIDPARVTHFSSHSYDFRFCGLTVLDRSFYEMTISPAELAAMTLGEGREMRLFAGDEILSPPYRVAPYDAFGLWMHHHRRRIGPGP